MFDVVRTRLMKLRVPELKDTARLLNVRLTGAGKKAEIVERLITMALIDAIRKIGSDSADAPPQLTYITEDLRRVLGSLPAFDAVVLWSKDFGTVVKEFHFMNVLTYLVYGRDKTFDMESVCLSVPERLSLFRRWLREKCLDAQPCVPGT